MSVASTKQPSPAGSLFELVAIVAIAVSLAFVIQAVLVKPFRIPSESMERTLDVGQRVLVDRVSFHFSEPHRGDVIVFHPPQGAEDQPPRCGILSRSETEPCPRATPGSSQENFIKRVVAEPGDRLQVIDGKVHINGQRQPEPFALPCPDCDQLTTAITIPPGHFFMMGDNRGQSSDSRVWGPIARDQIVGHAFLTYWPPRRIGTL